MKLCDVLVESSKKHNGLMNTRGIVMEEEWLGIVSFWCEQNRERHGLVPGCVIHYRELRPCFSDCVLKLAIVSYTFNPCLDL